MFDMIHALHIRCFARGVRAPVRTVLEAGRRREDEDRCAQDLRLKLRHDFAYSLWQAWRGCDTLSRVEAQLIRSLPVGNEALGDRHCER